MRITKTAFTAIIAESGVTMTGNVITVTTAVRARVRLATRNITADIAAPVTMTTSCATTAATALRITANVTKNAADATTKGRRFVLNAAKNAQAVRSGSATTAASVPNVQATMHTALFATSASAVPNGSATVATDVRDVPWDAPAATRCARTVSLKKCVSSAHTV